MKTCNECGHLKDLEEFPIKGYTKSGQPVFRGRCRSCHNEKRRAGIVRPPKVKKTAEEVSQQKALINKQIAVRNREWLVNYKSQLSCFDCGLPFLNKPWLCDFHHREPENKHFELSQVGSYSIEKILEEVAKCDPLCANCHRTRHNQNSTV